MFRRLKKVRNGKVPFYLALGYLIWCILPHAAFQVHEHAGGERAHTHLSYHDAGLRNETLISANPEEVVGETRGESASPEDLACLADTGTGASHLLKAANLRHGHFTEDENILGTGLSTPSALLPEVHPTSAPALTLAPLLPYTGPATARGPPSLA